jgi:hypothetical protein
LELPGLSPGDWKAIRENVRRYMQVWQAPEDLQTELANDAINEVRQAANQISRVEAQTLAIAEVEKQLRQKLDAMLLGELGKGENGIANCERMALFCGNLPEQWQRVREPAALREAYRRGLQNIDRALEPSRQPETELTTMETSLSRLPSLRIIAGWFLLIAGLIAAFVMTH